MNKLLTIFFISLFTLTFLSCKKQVAGPRKVTAIGEIVYNSAADVIATEIYPKNDARIFSMKFERDYDISGDISGTWQESGAQMLLFVDGDFGPAGNFPIDHGYYETRDFIAIEGHEVNMREFAEKQYYVVVTRGTAGGVEFYQYFVFE